DENVRSVQRFSLHVEGIDDFVDDGVRHRRVDMSGKLDEARLESLLFRLPGEIERVDRDAVAAEAGPRMKRPEPERLGSRSLHDFPDVDAELVAHQRDLVDE